VQELAAVSKLLVRFVDRVRWSALCEHPMQIERPAAVEAPRAGAAARPAPSVTRSKQSTGGRYSLAS